MHAYNSNTWEVEAGGSEVWDYPQMLGEFESALCSFESPSQIKYKTKIYKQKIYFCFTSMNVCLRVCMCVVYDWCLRRPEEYVGSLETEGCELPYRC